MNGPGELPGLPAADLELIGEGGNSRVYRLGRDRVVKVFHEDIPQDMVQYEYEQSRAAYDAGVRCAECFGMVRVNDCPGIVYKNLGSRDLLSVIVRDKEHLQDYIRDFARQVRDMHSRSVDTARLKNKKQEYESFLDRLQGHLCSPDEVSRLKRIFTVIPERTTFIHGDCHPGNVMEQDGKLTLIDLSSCGYGHPVFDLAGMYSIYLMSAQDEERRKNLVPARDFTAAQCRMIWETFLESYFETGDGAFLQKAQQQIRGFVLVRRLLRTLIVADKDLYLYHEAKQKALAYVDQDLDPLCF